MNMPIDLRSDTVTKPTAAMREFIANCEVDDDVIRIALGVELITERRRTPEEEGPVDLICFPASGRH